MDLRVEADFTVFKKLLADYPAEALAAMNSRVTEAALMTEGAVKTKTPVGAGPIHLQDTIFHKVNTAGESVWGLISTPAEYGLPVELGTRPHFPPVAPIEHWVEKKLGITGKEAHTVAYLIARAISKRGTKGAKMFTATYQALQGRILEILNKIPDDIIARLNKE